jgi:hypothetical protein
VAARSQLKRVHGLALAGLVLATGIALFVSALKDEQRAPQRKVATAVARRTALAPLLAAELRRVALTPPELGNDAPAADARSATAAPAGGDAPLGSADLRAHARGMLLPALLRAVDEGDAEHARWLRDQLADPQVRSLLDAQDVEALELAFDCLEHAPDAREEARDMLQFGRASFMTEALARACK